jgi:hypothetical protein
MSLARSALLIAALPAVLLALSFAASAQALFPAISANPFLSFFTIAQESGKFEFERIGDKGFSETASAPISVE